MILNTSGKLSDVLFPGIKLSNCILYFSQLFEVYDTIPDPSLGQMVEIVKGAVNLCSGIYICVGFFGYIAFYSVDFGGIIMCALPVFKVWCSETHFP
jgi:hypothetical protein